MRSTSLAKTEIQKYTYQAVKEQPKERPAAGRRNRALNTYRALFLTVLFSCLTLVVIGTALVSVYASISNMEIQRGALLKKIEEEKQILQQRKVEFSKLSDPIRIKNLASKRLGMVEATEVVFIELNIKPKEKEEKPVLSKATQLYYTKSTIPSMR
ncbi:MAG: hypothetical protein N2440_01935 [Actinobacteria bacterium]|nr:hypothetical protein [Actinomycetota bacterium]